MVISEVIRQIPETEPKILDEKMEKLRVFYEKGETIDYNFRKNQLKKLLNALIKYESDIIEAVQMDLGKSTIEAFVTEVGVIKSEIKFVLRNLKKWMKPKKIKVDLFNFGAKSHVEQVPKGVVLIIGPWNYPIHLILWPLVSAISAGNCVMVKPSELSINSSHLLSKIIKETFDDDYVTSVEGGPETVQYLLNHHWGHILFTGSTKVGKIVYEMASKTLTPVTLEMGGKSPTVVDDTTNLKFAVNRIILAKFVNNGQTCIAPDYIIIKENIKDQFIELSSEAIEKFYSTNVENSPDYGHIINLKHYERLKSLINDSHTIIYPNSKNYDPNKLFIPPIFVINPPLDSKIMSEEIFGPILPIFTYNTFDDIKKIIDKNSDPLTMYIYSKDNEFINNLKIKIDCGDFIINDSLLYFGIAGLPIGGVNSSGLGEYHGKYGFDTFSRPQSILKKTMLFDIPLKYPPYNKLKLKLARLLFR